MESFESLFEQADSLRPRINRDLPAVSGAIRARVEDFVVEELPAYDPSGEGEHLFLWIEKRNVSGEYLRREIARRLGLRDRDVGMAGLKDRRALTRQFVSVPASCGDAVGRIETEDIRILQRKRHGNKLRTGHLRGNRFSIIIRDCSFQTAGSPTTESVGDVEGEISPAAIPDDPAIATALQTAASRIQQTGMPNYFGGQRFGFSGSTARKGFEQLRQIASTSTAPRRRRRGGFLQRLELSAAQSVLFNVALAERIRESIEQRVLLGDVLQRTESGGTFVAEEIDIEQDRLLRGETVISGPMFGPKMIAAQHTVAAREARLLEMADLLPSAFERFGSLTQGTRRPYIIRPDDLNIAAHDGSIRLNMSLPAGVYATELLRELLGGEIRTGAATPDNNQSE